MFRDLKAQARPRNFLEPRDVVQDSQELLREGIPGAKPVTVPVPQQTIPSTLKPVPGASSGALAAPPSNTPGR